MVDSSYRGPNAARATNATEGAGGRDERVDERTTNESPWNKKADERGDKGVNRTKDKSHDSRANGLISGNGPLGCTLAAAEEGGS